MTRNIATPDSAPDIPYPTGQYNRDRAQHQFTMLIGVILVVAGIGFGIFSAFMLKGDWPWVAVLLLLFAVVCLVLGLGAAVPDGRNFFPQRS